VAKGRDIRNRWNEVIWDPYSAFLMNCYFISSKFSYDQPKWEARKLNMIKRKFGWTNVQVPVIGQGTWMIEGDQGSERLAIEGLRLGLDLGLTHIDTAEMYGNGHVEEMVAESIADRREELFLVSKVLPSNASFEGTLKACAQSLKRLKTDWLDLYLLHWPGPHPIKETSGVGDGIHESQDIAKVISIGVNVLRLEDLVVTNGPNLFVYLSTDKSASDFMNLGRLKTSMLGSEDCIGSLVFDLHVCPLSFLPNRTLLSPTLYVA